MFESLKKDLQLSDAVPFLVGGLGEFLATNQELLANFPYMINSPKVDKALQTLANTNEYIGYVSAEGLTSNPDGLHFNAASLRTFGVRYFEKFRDMNTLMKVGQEIFFEDGLTELERI